MKSLNANFFSSQDVSELVTARIDQALNSNQKFKDFEEKYCDALRTKDPNIIDDAVANIQAEVERTAYLQGWRDCFAMCMDSLR